MSSTDTNVNKRSRLNADDSRAAAIVAARALLIAEGPQAVTLKAVGARVGRGHANLLHPFGSAAGLQSALAADIVGRVIIPPGELPVGIVTAFVGAPVLIWLIRRSNATGL